MEGQDPEVRQRFLERAQEGRLTRDENERSHFCVYFLPYNPETKQVFIVHHKKSGLWISPGGHIDRGEDLLLTLNREIKEELGVEHEFSELPQPFFLSITPIDNTVQPCKEHLDSWFLFQTDGKNFNVDPHEFHSTQWVDVSEVGSLVTDPANLGAVSRVREM